MKKLTKYELKLDNNIDVTVFGKANSLKLFLEMKKRFATNAAIINITKKSFIILQNNKAANYTLSKAA